MFVSYSGVKDDEGDVGGHDRSSVQILINSIILRQFTSAPDRTIGYLIQQHEVTLGLKHQWRAGSVFTAAARYEDFQQTITRPLTTIACNGLDVSQIPLFAAVPDLGSRAPTPILFSCSTHSFSKLRALDAIS